jgi:hypothetical protein
MRVAIAEIWFHFFPDMITLKCMHTEVGAQVFSQNDALHDITAAVYVRGEELYSLFC